MDVQTLKTYAKGGTSCTFFMTVAWYDWFASGAVHLSALKLLGVATLGFGVCASVLYATIITMAGAATYAMTGDFEGGIEFFAIAVVACPAVTFLATRALTLWLA